MEKVIILKTDGEKVDQNSVNKLSEYLSEGWTVKQVTPFRITGVVTDSVNGVVAPMLVVIKI